MRLLELHPAPHEIAVAVIPAGIGVRLPGVTGRPWEAWTRYVAVPGAALGWGAACSWLEAKGIARNRHVRDRAVWQKAARALGSPRLRHDETVVLYVVHEQRDWYGKTVWAAVRIREED